MPRYRKPLDLSHQCMKSIARSACRALHKLQQLYSECENEPEEALLMAVQIRDFISEVPAHLADDLVRHTILQLDSVHQIASPRGVAVLLHPKCQTLDLNEPALAACKPQVIF